VLDQVAVVRGHEVQVPRVLGRDHRPVEVHRLGEREAEAFGAMQRDVAVARGDHRVLLVRRDEPVHQLDARVLCGGDTDPFAVGRVSLRVGRLEQKRCVGVRGEGAPERLDQPERVLALEDAVVVEDEQEAEAVRQPELRPVTLREAGGDDRQVIFVTGIGERARTASATWSLATQTSSR